MVDPMQTAVALPAEEWGYVLGWFPNLHGEARWAVCYWYRHSSGEIMWGREGSAGAHVKPPTHWLPLPDRPADHVPESLEE